MIFISGANISSGGPLEIYRNILGLLASNYREEKVIAIVSEKQLFLNYTNVRFIEIKNYKKFIFLKFYYEYFKYLSISKNYDIKLWLSLNDCSPTVKAKRRAVYCHNATPFYKRSLTDFLNPTRPFLQSFYYNLFYKLNLHKNDFIIVQQNWFRAYFENKFKVPEGKIIVNPIKRNEINITHNREFNDEYIFIYPTKAEPYKNLEVILEAVSKLNKHTLNKFKVIITVSANENRYSRGLFNQYKHLINIEWVGGVSRDELERLYEKSDCLLFSSKLETWGLPISEFMRYNRPILLVNLPYAKETIGNYDFVKFFNANDSDNLMKLMIDLIEKKEINFDQTFETPIKEPYVTGLVNLLTFLLKH